PGGTLVFCTCSLFPEEGEEQVAAALARNGDLELAPGGDGFDAAWITPEGTLRLRPDHWADQGGIDGFFVARFQKRP
ncbi:MAG: 16S rRNA methyltransferase, partial [Silicimonas sp.]|nr:16S rRNA methyltransferase [Silicimonas sp.]